MSLRAVPVRQALANTKYKRAGALIASAHIWAGSRMRGAPTSRSPRRQTWVSAVRSPRPWRQLRRENIALRPLHHRRNSLQIYRRLVSRILRLQRLQKTHPRTSPGFAEVTIRKRTYLAMIRSSAHVPGLGYPGAINRFGPTMLGSGRVRRMPGKRQRLYRSLAPLGGPESEIAPAF